MCGRSPVLQQHRYEVLLAQEDFPPGSGMELLGDVAKGWRKEPFPLLFKMFYHEQKWISKNPSLLQPPFFRKSVPEVLSAKYSMT